MIFLIRFLNQKIPQMTSVKKDHFINLDKLIWTCQRDWVVNLDLVVLINRVINYLTSRQWTI
jgi:hypothetical protein